MCGVGHDRGRQVYLTLFSFWRVTLLDENGYWEEREIYKRENVVHGYLRRVGDKPIPAMKERNFKQKCFRWVFPVWPQMFLC